MVQMAAIRQNYVRRHTPEGWRRGVTLVWEIVPRRAIAWLARTLYTEPYLACPMRPMASARKDSNALTLAGMYCEDGK